MRLVLFALVVLLAAVAVFAVQNPGVITVRFFHLTAETAILGVIAAAFAAGAVAGFLASLPSSFRKSRRIRELESAASREKPPPDPGSETRMP